MEPWRHLPCLLEVGETSDSSATPALGTCFASSGKKAPKKKNKFDPTQNSRQIQEVLS